MLSCYFILVVRVQYEQDRYTVVEEVGYVTLALVLEGEAPFPVTVIVNTSDLLNSSIGDAATGELLKLSVLNILQGFLAYIHIL